MRNKDLNVFLFAGILFCSGCSACHNRRPPFSAYVGKEVTLQRPVVVAEYVSSFFGDTLFVEWEHGRPTSLLMDDRMFSRPAKIVKTSWGGQRKFYPVAEYSRRSYEMREAQDFIALENGTDHSGPLRLYYLAAGTPLRISKAFTANRIDYVCHTVEGSISIPELGKAVDFTYLYGCNTKYIGRAPWEDLSTPEQRFVGNMGRGYKKTSE